MFFMDTNVIVALISAGATLIAAFIAKSSSNSSPQTKENPSKSDSQLSLPDIHHRALPSGSENMILKSFAMGEISNPTPEQIIASIDNLVCEDENWDKAFLILVDNNFENAFAQVRRARDKIYFAEYRDGYSGRQFVSPQISKETVRLLFLAYLKRDNSIIHVLDWEEITEKLKNRETTA